MSSPQVPWLFDLGRVAMPLFGFVLAYNLARPGALANGVFKRTGSRLLRYGAVATIPFVALKAPVGGEFVVKQPWASGIDRRNAAATREGQVK